MLVVRFKVQCKPEKTDQALATFREVIAPSRVVDGVVSYDIARDLADPNSIIAVEVFEDRAALERQESVPAVQKIIGLLDELHRHTARSNSVPRLILGAVGRLKSRQGLRRALRNTGQRSPLATPCCPSTRCSTCQFPWRNGQLPTGG